MFSRPSIPSLALSIAIVALVFFFIQKNNENPSLPKTNPIARVEYELLRTKSPLSGVVPTNIRQRELAFARTLPTREEINAKSRYRGKSPATLNWKSRGP